MPTKRRSKGSGTLFKKSNGRYALRFVQPDGHVTSVTLHNDKGEAITQRADALTAAEKICKERQHVQQIETKIEYMTKVAQAKHLIMQAKIELCHLWETYLQQPDRPDSGNQTLETYKGVLEAFLEYCRGQRIQEVSQITPELAGQYLQRYWQTNIAPRTYNRHLQALKLIFKTVQKEDSPFAEFRTKTVETESHKPFTPEQINQIFAKIDDPKFYLLHRDEMRIMLMLGLAFGLRLHDAACFQWSYIKGGIVEFKPAKTKKHLHESLVLPIPEILQEQFEKAKAWRVDQYLLPNIAKRYTFNKSGISQDVAKLLESAGIETKEDAGDDIRRMKYIDNNGVERTRHISRYSFHSFRHTFCSMAANAGMDLSVVRSIVGHTNISMTEHYTHYSLESKRQVIEALPLLSHHNQGESLSELIVNLHPTKLAVLGQWLEDRISMEEKKTLKSLLY